MTQCSSAHIGVLLGVAEVKVPLRHLPDEVKEKLSHICYRRLLDINSPPEVLEDEPARCIGVVDSFYALQEVILTVENGLCRLWRKSEIVLQYSLRDVIMSVAAKDHANRIIIICRTENFGRTATVLQMKDERSVNELVLKLFPPRTKSRTPSRTSSYAGSTFRRGAGSFGKVMTKKLNVFLSALHSPTHDKPPSAPSTPTSAPTPVLENRSSDHFDYEYDDDDDEETESDSDDSPDSELEKKVEDTEYTTTHAQLIIATPSLSPIEAELEFLIDSERKYLDALKAAFHDYHMVIQSDFPMTKDEVKSVFSYIQELRDFHQKFLPEIISTRSEIATLYQVFERHSSDLKIYLNFIANIPTTDAILASHADFFKQKFPNLPENLRKPRMRLNHYVLFLESFQRKISQDCKDSLQNVIDKLKEYLKEADTRLVIGSVHNCKFPLLEHGTVVLNSELFLKSGLGLPKRRYQVIVLQDLMVLAKGRQECCQYVSSFNLSDIEIIHALRGLLIHLKIKRVGRSSFRLIFKAKTIKYQQKWIESLKQQKDKLKSLLVAKELNKTNEFLTSLVISNQIKDDLITLRTKDPSEKKQLRKERSSSVFYADLHMGDFERMPPLTIQVGLSSLTPHSKLSSQPTDEYDNQDDLVTSERLLITQLRNAREVFSKSEHLKVLFEQIYDMHSKNLYPASQTNINKCDVHILCHHLLAIAQNFTKLYSEILFYFSVLVFELPLSEEEKLYLKMVFENFWLLQTIIRQTQESFHDQNSVFGEAFKVTDTVIKISNNLLKKKYVENLPPDFSSDVLMEGPLSIEPTQDEKIMVHAILTKAELSILHYSGASQYKLIHQLPMERGKLGPPPGIKAFEIIFTAENKKKLRYQFEAKSVADKTKWLAILQRRIPMASKERKKSLVSNLRKDSFAPLMKVSNLALSSPKGSDNCLESNL